MNCPTKKEKEMCKQHKCCCPKKECANNGKCCACIANHRAKDGVPHCIFPDNNGKKDLESFYLKLKERFEK